MRRAAFAPRAAAATHAVVTSTAVPLLLGACWMGCALLPSPRVEMVSDGHYVMGTLLEITLGEVSERTAAKSFQELFAHAARLEDLMSRYDSQSQISRLNRAAGQGPQQVDPALADLLQRSVRFSELTRGTFDVTVGPLVQLWIDAAVAGTPPSAAEIAERRARVGADAIRIHSDGSVELDRPGVVVDLGGIAKGYALDGMVPLLHARNIERALLSFGQSSTLALGVPPNADGWRLLARGPNEEVLGVLTLRDQALSVSSSFGHSLEIGGVRYGHVIDPRDGRPLSSPLEALVVAPDATLAEALSKALLILDPDEGLALVADLPGCAGMLVDGAGGVRTTAEWQRETHFEPGVPAGLAGGPEPQAEGATFRFQRYGGQGTLVQRVQRGPAPRG